MAKQFARIGKDITIAVKSGGPGPEQQPDAAPRDPERARDQHAEGQGRGRDQARLRPGRRGFPAGALRRLCAARRRGARRDRDRQPDAHRRERAQHPVEARRQPREQWQRQLPVPPHGRLPARTRPASTRTSSSSTSSTTASTKWARAPARTASRSSSCAALSRISASSRSGSRSARSCRSRPSRNTSARCRSELPEAQANEALEVIDKLEQDDDVQKVYHTLA